MENQFQEILEDLNNVQNKITQFISELNVSPENKKKADQLTEFLKKIGEDRKTVRTLLEESLKENAEENNENSSEKAEHISEIKNILNTYGMPDDIETVNSDFTNVFDNFLDDFRTNELCNFHDILKIMTSAEKEKFFEKIKQAFNEDVYEKIKRSGFTFEDIPLLDDLAVQKFLREVDTAELAVSLINADEKIKDKIINNMSARAGHMLLEDIEYLKPSSTKKSIFERRDCICSIIYRLEEIGEIVFPSEIKSR